MRIYFDVIDAMRIQVEILGENHNRTFSSAQRRQIMSVDCTTDGQSMREGSFEDVISGKKVKAFKA